MNKTAMLRVMAARLRAIQPALLVTQPISPWMALILVSRPVGLVALNLVELVTVS